MIVASVLHAALALTLAPLLPGIINRTKAFFAGRRGQPILQSYYDILKLLRKGGTYSRTTTWIFRAGPISGLASMLISILVIPLGGVRSLVAFPGDMFLLVYLAGLMRFMTVLAALDTGSPFEGMGGSREMQFSILAEPALILGLAALAAGSRSLSLSEMYADPLSAGAAHTPALVLIAFALGAVLLTENARIPIDDPNTHLELTMIHEVMVLDHGGIDLAFVHYSSSLKFWMFGALWVGIAWPVRTGLPVADLGMGIAGLFVMAIIVGVIESVIARLRLTSVPQLLAAASVLSFLSVFWMLR